MLSIKTFDRLWATVEGRILLANLATQLEAHIVPEDYVVKLFIALENSTGSDLKDIWNQIITSSKSDSTLKTLYFASNQKQVHDELPLLLRIAPFRAILANLVSSSVEEYDLIRDEFEGQQDRLRKEDLDRFERRIFSLMNGAAERRRSDFSHGGIPWLEARLASNIKFNRSTADDPAFCTSSSTADREFEIFRDREGIADRARDILGLVHYDNNPNYGITALGAIAFAPADLEGASRATFARPTIADMVSTTRFKGVFGSPGKKADRWGRAFDLSLIDAQRPYRGGREIVVPARVPHKVHFAFLGYLRIPRGDMSNDPRRHKKFEEICMRGRSREHFVSILVK
ncbi:hypothetical protein GCM10010520_51520 [Rhizobium viscosum]